MADMERCNAAGLEAFARRVFGALGADEDVAAEVARHLVRANLSGHDSHGVIRVPQYVEQAKAGEVVAPARPTLLRETAGVALVDGKRSFGQFSTTFALDWAMRGARRHGIASAAVRHSTHIGRLGHYAEQCAGQGLVGMVTVGMAGLGVGGLVIHGGRERFFGANPWAFGIPAAGRAPVVFDASTSTVAEGKVRVALAKGASLPAGCIIDRDGNPATDPRAFYDGGALTPLGGDVAGHKGYGLALVSALLGALCMIDDPDPTLAGSYVAQGRDDPRGRVAGVTVVVVDPAAFGDASHYAAMVAETASAAKRVPAAPGFAEVLIPGELEARNREQREREGIVLPRATRDELDAVARELRVPFPT